MTLSVLLKTNNFGHKVGFQPKNKHKIPNKLAEILKKLPVIPKKVPDYPKKKVTDDCQACFLFFLFFLRSQKTCLTRTVDLKFFLPSSGFSSS